MSKQTIQEKYEAEFREFLKEKLDKIKKEQSELESLICGKDFGDSSSSTNILKVEVKQPISEYKSIWTWKQKVIYILKQSDATTTEIVSKVLEHEPELNGERSKIVGTISAILSAKSKNPSDLFSKYQNDRGLSVYKLNQL